MDGAPVVQNLAGKTLDDCTLLTPLGVGRGGTTVWKAARPDGSLAAVKIIEDAGNRAAFETAIKTAAQLRHHRIAVVERFGRTGAGRSYVVSEFVDGEFLERVLTRGPVPLHAAVEIGFGILEALQYAHDEGVLHEGIRPSNVAVRGRDAHGRLQVKLVDFGLDALPESIRERGAPEHLDVRALRYTAPELFVTGKSTPESDLYAVGALLYHLVTGQAPFDGTSAASLKRAHLARQPPSLAEVVPSGPGWDVLDRVCVRLMAKQPAQRMSRAADVMRALETVIAAAPPAVYEVDELDVMEARSVTTGPHAAAPPASAPAPTESQLPPFGAGIPAVEAQPQNPGVRQTTVLPAPLATINRPVEVVPGPGERRAILAALVVLVASVGTWLWSGPFEMPKNQVRSRGLQLDTPKPEPRIKITRATAQPKATAPVDEAPQEAGRDSEARRVEAAPAPVPDIAPPDSPPATPPTRITTVPAGAALSLADGSSLGHTPWAGRLPSGVERIRISREGFITAWIPVEPGQDISALALRPVVTAPPPPVAPPSSTVPTPRPVEATVPAKVRPRVESRNTERAPAAARPTVSKRSRPARPLPKIKPVPAVAVPAKISKTPLERPPVPEEAPAKSASAPRIGVADIPDGLMPGEVAGGRDGPPSVFLRSSGDGTAEVNGRSSPTASKTAKPAAEKQSKKRKPRIQLLGD